MSKKNNDNGYIFNRVYDSYVSNTRKKGMNFDIHIDKFKKIITCACYYCGRTPNPPYSQENKAHFEYTGIDRIDSSIGYDENNIVPCCKICNRFKMDMPLNAFIRWIKNIHEFTVIKNENR